MTQFKGTFADELAKNQRSISVAEFFEKNKHLLGFDSPSRGIITTIKEAVDNSLDATEEAEFLPDIYLSVEKETETTLKVVVEDNGPGIVPEQIPFVFGKLLYGSRFHQIKQSRGQQGIGISAAVLYGQLTSGKPTKIISRCGAGTPASLFHIKIHTETNEPEIILNSEQQWDRTHGTRIEISFKGSLSAKKRLLEYLKYSSVTNPHAKFTFELEGETHIYERASEEPIKCPVPVKPHPHGIQFGELKRLIANKEIRTLTIDQFLVHSFSKIGPKTAAEICTVSEIQTDKKTQKLTDTELEKLLEAMQKTNIPAPSGLCLSPIGKQLLKQGIEKEFRVDFISATTRSTSVQNGHPFIVEAALGYGGDLDPEGTARIMRFANRVPLIYQQGACVVTSAVSGINWKTYGITQNPLPKGPLLILVHVASTNVPFTSESKDAIAHIPEIEHEIVLALQELGRELKTFLKRRDKSRVEEERARAVCSVIPEIALKVAETLNLPVPDTSGIEGRIMKKVIAKKQTANGKVTIEVSNFTGAPLDLMVYSRSENNKSNVNPEPVFVQEINGIITTVWSLHIKTGEIWSASYRGSELGTPDIRGAEKEKVLVMDLDI